MRKPSVCLAILMAIVVVGFGSFAYAKPNLNSQRVNREPGWAGPGVLRGNTKEANRDIPILERSYRPMHVYGNMTRRHHYRGTVIPSHHDRVDFLQAVVTKQPVPHEYVKNRYR